MTDHKEYPNFGELVDGEMDYRYYKRTFSGRLTAKRFRIIDKWVKRQDIGSIHVASDRDCTGQCSGQYCNVSFVRHFLGGYQVTITTDFSYDY